MVYETFKFSATEKRLVWIKKKENNHKLFMRESDSSMTFYPGQLKNTHRHTHPSFTSAHRVHAHFYHPVGMCFSRSFEAKIFELHESSYEVLPSGSLELLRPSDNTSIPRIHQAENRPPLLMLYRKQKMNKKIVYVTRCDNEYSFYCS